MSAKSTKSKRSKAARAERLVDRWCRTQRTIRIELGSQLSLEYEINPTGCRDYWMLNFGDDEGRSVSPTEAAALIAAANGPHTALHAAVRLLDDDELGELREAAAEARATRRGA